jgi:DNA-binding LacI/PurR family transcriptional regulator
VVASSKRVTLRDVAAASGVSRSTVSFVLRDDPGQAISAATRERVRRAALELGYVPHGIARALREGSSRIVVLNVGTGLETNYTRSYIRGLDDELAAHGHVLLVRHGHAAPGSAQEVLDAIAPRAVMTFGEAYLTPGHEFDDGGWTGGLAGNIGLQIGYLAGRGHARVAFALPAGELPLGEMRLRFAREAARMHGVAEFGSLVVPSDRSDAASAVGSVLAVPGAPTAVACSDDDTALRILAALRDLGLTAPDDLAVIGFDDLAYGAFSGPALTTVHIDAEDHGRQAARVILGLGHSDLAPAPGQLIIRQSA